MRKRIIITLHIVAIGGAAVLFAYDKRSAGKAPSDDLNLSHPSHVMIPADAMLPADAVFPVYYAPLIKLDAPGPGYRDQADDKDVIGDAMDALDEGSGLLRGGDDRVHGVAHL